MANAQGYCNDGDQGYVMVDIPGCYSLMAHSTEEEVARDFICFENPDGVVVVCDATCLERNLNLVLQILEAAGRVVVCVNLMDEAKKKRITVRFDVLEERLGVPVVGTAARSKKGLEKIYGGLRRVMEEKGATERIPVRYPEYIEAAIARLTPAVKAASQSNVQAASQSNAQAASQSNAQAASQSNAQAASQPNAQAASRPKVNTRWLCARLLDANENLMGAVRRYLTPVAESDEIKKILEEIRSEWQERGISQKKVSDDMASVFIRKAEYLCRGAVIFENQTYHRRDRVLDRLFTSKATGFPIMFLILLGIFWLTITGANYPSEVLSSFLFSIEDRLSAWSLAAGMPVMASNLLFHGIYRVLAWVVSVMLPPMAIFFPLFTLLEDFGYLPRVAFNLDRCFKRCSACGKQALTMCMDFLNL